MKYVDEYRKGIVVTQIARAIERTATRPWVLMEVCGGHTHAIVRYGIDELLPSKIELSHGPGCALCTTALETIDRAHAIASLPDVIFTSFGDMLRVPGSRGDLLTLRSSGADVRVVHSPLDALNVARTNPDKRVVLFGIGFETTAPANATAVDLAKREGIFNFSLLASHALMPPAIEAILATPGNRVQGFLGPGHVCVVTGLRAYEALSQRYRVPIVVTGFEPVDLLDGVLRLVRQLEQGRAEVENQYVRAVTDEGNRAAQDLLGKVFEVVDRHWRGIGTIPKSGYRLSSEYRGHDAEHVFEVEAVAPQESPICMSGLVLRGLKKPRDCAAFGTACTPHTPLGATMVSAEGACHAYYQYGRRPEPAT